MGKGVDGIRLTGSEKKRKPLFFFLSVDAHRILGATEYSFTVLESPTADAMDFY